MRNLLRPVLILVSGTALAQVITLLLAPVLSRIYSPSDFGMLAVYVSLTSTFGVIASLRLEYAIPAADSDSEAWAVLRTAVRISAIIGTFLLLVGLIFGQPVANAFGQPQLAPFLPLLGVAIFSMGVFQSLVQWNARNGSFSLVASSQIGRSVTTNTVQLLAGLTGIGGAGLVTGHILGQLMASTKLSIKSGLRVLSSRSIEGESAAALAKYRDFTLYGTPQALLNSLSQNLPSLIFSVVISPAAAGLYALAHRLLSAPANLLGESIRQALYPKLAEAMRQGVALRLAMRMVLLMAGLVAVPVVVVALFGPHLFATVLGEEWFDAGVMARYMAFLTAAGILNIPSVCLIQLLRLQRWHATYEVVYVVVRAAALLTGALRGDAILAVILYAGSGIVFNLFLTAAPLIALARHPTSTEPPFS